MRDPAIERCGFGKLIIDVNGVVVAGCPGKENNVGVGDGFRERGGLG